jgi:hypothetical protein
VEEGEMVKLLKLFHICFLVAIGKMKLAEQFGGHPVGIALRMGLG